MNLDDAEGDARAFVAQRRVGYRTVLTAGSDVAERYNVHGIPHFVMINQAGQVVQEWAGFAPGFDTEWRKIADALLNQPST